LDKIFLAVWAFSSWLSKITLICKIAYYNLLHNCIQLFHNVNWTRTITNLPWPKLHCQPTDTKLYIYYNQNQWLGVNFGPHTVVILWHYLMYEWIKKQCSSFNNRGHTYSFPQRLFPQRQMLTWLIHPWAATGGRWFCNWPNEACIIKKKLCNKWRLYCITIPLALIKP